MRLSRILCLLIFWLAGLKYAYAQIPNEWQIVPVYGQKNTNFSKYCGYDKLIIEEKKRGMSVLFLIHDSLGKIKYNIGYDSCWDKNQNYLKNSSLPFKNNDPNNYIAAGQHTAYHTTACATKLKANQYYVFSSIPIRKLSNKDSIPTNIRLVYRILDDTVNNGKGGFASTSYTLLTDKPLFYQNIVPFNNLKGYWLIAKSIKFYYIFKIDSKGINLYDSLSTGNEKFLLQAECFMSATGKSLLSYTHTNFYKEERYKEYLEFNLYNFNNVTGKLSYNRKIDILKLYNDGVFDPSAFPAGFSISPNDSLLYINFSYDFKFYLKVSDKTMVQLDLYDNTRYYWIDSSYGIQAYHPQYSRMSGDGKLNFVWSANGFILFGKKKYYISQIHNPNIFGSGCNFQNHSHLVTNESFGGLAVFSNFLSLYRPSSIKTKKNCKGYVTFYSFLDSFYKKGILTIDNKVVYTAKQNLDSFTVKLPPGKHYYMLTAVSGIYPDVCLYDSIELLAPPIANYTTTDTIGCQWLGFIFNDISQSLVNTSTYYSYWNFGDGKDTLISGKVLPLNSPTHVYTKEGNYKVQLVFDNGQCKDTFSQIKTVTILPAPKPGITADPLTGCTLLKIGFKYKYNDVVDSIVWKSGFAGLPSYKGNSGNFIYNQTGLYWLNQKLYGKSGCITSDSILINVRPGISGMPDILYATVTNENTIDIKWKSHLNAVKYSIYKNNNFFTQTTDTFFIDYNSNTLIPNSYSVKAISLCNDSSTLVDLAQTIYLQGKISNNNEANLSWTPYKYWDNGVNFYQIFTQNVDGNFELLASLNNQTFGYLDKGFIEFSGVKRCYKIMADEKDGNFQSSSSNIFCIPLKPVILIPNAFSPNNDFLNENFFIFTQGITNIKLNIFNSWGELIYSNNSELLGWDGKYKENISSVGFYIYQIVATAYNGDKIYKNGVFEIVK